ncbi:hypothetical protein DY000_02039796 [Brassica cretica]|uniref:RNase H type-1 domain-containing protein n=1 Tax=Brassica cretica TaxID=69181 RepID=A0ABQ7B686_BRACR|nr:hypothetical protein DY000_02039796 [Brassica cretica]
MKEARARGLDDINFVATAERENDFSMFPWLIWYVWKARNEKCFNAKDISPLDTLQLAQQEAETWKVAQLGDEITEEDEPSIQRHQSLPPSHTRTDRRRRKRSFKDRFAIIGLSHLHAEAEGIIWAMKEARARGLDDINFVSDCQQLMNLVNRDEVWPALTTELNEIKYLLSKFQSVVLTFLPGSCNIRADSLAKGGHSRAHCFAVVNSLVPLLPALEARHEEQE